MKTQSLGRAFYRVTIHLNTALDDGSGEVEYRCDASSWCLAMDEAIAYAQRKELDPKTFEISVEKVESVNVKTQSLDRAFQLGFEIDGTGGGCAWLRKGNIAITDGDAGLPIEGEPVMMVTLNDDGDYDERFQPQNFSDLETALRHLFPMP